MADVAVVVFEQDGSSFYRLAEPARVLREQGAPITVVRPGDPIPEADIIVVNRPVLAPWADFVEDMVAEGRRVVVDIDDSYEHLASNHMARVVVDPNDAARACKAATAVVVTTPALVTVYPAEELHVVPNYVPQRYLDVVPKAGHEGLWVGWAGSVTAHPNDLLVANDRIGRAVNEEGATVAFVGSRDQTRLVAAQLGYKGPVVCTNFMEIGVYPEAVSNFDVGIVPLDDTFFNECKSWLKGLEMAAVGVPFVASPTAEYQALFSRYGIGRPAKHPSDWYW